MPDRRRLGARPGRAEEEDVARRELREADPLRARNLAAHLVRRPALDRVVQRSPAGVLLQLVDAPDEAGAVEPAPGLHAERGFGRLVRAAPDVWIAHEAHGGIG